MTCRKTTREYLRTVHTVALCSELARELMFNVLESIMGDEMQIQAKNDIPHICSVSLEQVVDDVLDLDGGGEDIMKQNPITKTCTNHRKSSPCSHTKLARKPEQYMSDSSNTKSYIDANMIRDEQAELYRLYKIVGERNPPEKETDFGPLWLIDKPGDKRDE